MQRVASQCAALVLGTVLATLALPCAAVNFSATGLVTDDQTANPAKLTDAGLLNAWGIAASAGSPFWVSSNGAGTSNIYRVDPVTQAPTVARAPVTIPGAGNPTGLVFNSSGAAAFNGDAFLFVSEDGTVSGWRGALGSTAETLVIGSAANNYKGAAFAAISGNSYLYAANFRAAKIDIVKGNAGAPDLAGNFTDPGIPAGFAPFNVQKLGTSIYVNYAMQDATGGDEIAGPGLGMVSQFDLQGNFMARVATGASLNAPWALALAPASFGAQAGSLLVGNFGDGRINIYDPGTHAFQGQVLAGNGTPLSIDGLWALTAGNGVNGGATDMLYFTAGPGDESHGLLGVLTPVPEPASGALLASGLALVAALARRGRSGRRSAS